MTVTIYSHLRAGNKCFSYIFHVLIRVVGPRRILLVSIILYYCHHVISCDYIIVNRRQNNVFGVWFKEQNFYSPSK